VFEDAGEDDNEW